MQQCTSYKIFLYYFQFLTYIHICIQWFVEPCIISDSVLQFFSFKTLKFQTIDILPLVENCYNFNKYILWNELLLPFKYFIFDLLCYNWCNQGFVMQFAWIFLKIFKCYFHQGNIRKTMGKIFQKNTNFLLTFLPGSDLCRFFF